MAKILLVEDDNNLREIYEARLQAEGYTIVSAHDGEEALVIAKAEKPDLIISDVMMPKISGFEMLDILRNTDSLKNVKVIMLTALGQSDDQQKATSLGTDRYLVKSQVTLEDIVNVTNELVQAGPKSADSSATNVPTPSSPTTSSPPTAPVSDTPPSDAPVPSAQTPAADSGSLVVPATTDAVAVPVAPDTPPAPTSVIAPDSNQPSTPQPAATTESKLAESATEEENTVKSQIDNFADGQSNAKPKEEPATPPGQAAPGLGTPLATSPDDAPSQTAYKISGQPDAPSGPATDQSGYSPQPSGKKIIAPLPGGQDKPDINKLLEEEKAKEIIESNMPDPEAPPTMSAADTAPAPKEPVIKPVTQQTIQVNSSETVDPNTVAL